MAPQQHGANPPSSQPRWLCWAGADSDIRSPQSCSASILPTRDQEASAAKHTREAFFAQTGAWGSFFAGAAQSHLTVQAALISWPPEPVQVVAEEQGRPERPLPSRDRHPALPAGNRTGGCHQWTWQCQNTYWPSRHSPMPQP